MIRVSKYIGMASTQKGSVDALLERPWVQKASTVIRIDMLLET